MVMARPRVYKTEAIVLKRTNLGEADNIITLYTPNFGKIRAVAKGVRRPKSKLGGHLDLLTQSALLLAQGQNLDIITQAQSIESFLTLKSDISTLKIILSTDCCTKICYGFVRHAVASLSSDTLSFNFSATSATSQSFTNA
jgi:hypothetical protein